MYCIETQGLTHRFQNHEKVLDGIHLQVPKGAVYGFLGPNGAGKTTTLRLIPGLLKKQEGEISIFGESLETNRAGILRRMGTLIESPSLYGHLSASENLRIWQLVYDCDPKNIAEVLHLVGLADTKQKKVSSFSLGMKQRLSIAVALLHKPELLILDEPTNGLDPNGIIEMRELLLALNRETGLTILVSSHLLPEIEKLASHLGIIHKGNMLFQGKAEDLWKEKAFQKPVRFYCPPGDSLLSVLKAGTESQLTLREDGFEAFGFDTDGIADLNSALVRAGIPVYGIEKSADDLETLFLALVNKPEAI